MKAIKRIYLFLIILFLYAPILILVFSSFNASKYIGQWTGFTLDWYFQLIKDREIMNSLYVTLSMAVLAAIVSTIIGTLAAIGINSFSKTPKGIALNISYIPVVNADIVTGVSLMLLFIFTNVPRGYFTMLLAHITFCIPYVIFAVLPRLKMTSSQYYEAALDLGATPSYALRKVILPDIFPGIINGALLAFTLSLDDFVVSFFTTSNVNNLSTTIYAMARRGINPKINALSTLMFIAVVLLLLLINNRTLKQEKALRKEITKE